MAEEAQRMWDDQTDAFISEIDATVSKKYEIHLRELLLNPKEYGNTDKIDEKVKGLRADVDGYFDGMLSGLSDDEQELTKSLESADSVYTQINQVISSRAGIARIPFLKPFDMDFGGSAPETIYIDQYNGQIDTLITKLINASNYVCDLSATYRKYTIGTWVFSGSRSYVLAVNAPSSPVITVESARDQIDSMLDQVALMLAST